MWIGTVHLYVVDMQYGYLFYNCAGKGREQTQSKGSIMLLSFYTSLKSGSNDLHEVHEWGTRSFCTRAQMTSGEQ